MARKPRGLRRKSRLRRWVVRTVWVLILIGLPPAAYLFHRIATITTGYSAKILCSGVFVSERPPESVVDEDLEWFWMLRHGADPARATARSSLAGLLAREAFYREGLGCTLLLDTTPAELAQQTIGYRPPRPSANRDAPWPRGEGVDASSFLPALRPVVESALSEPDPEAPRRTRALVVVHRGQIVAEGYADSFGPQSRLAGWSMAKSVTNALVGILVREGKLVVEDRAPVPEWPPGDPRAVITLDHLLRMSSGLYFNEFYFGPSTATQMLFARPNAGAFAASQPLREAPDERWYYSSGTSNIVSRITRHRLGGSQADYFAFPRRALFGPLGMSSAVFEPDPSGTFVGSSFLYATARDWARFGLFYLQDGVWEGRRLLPEGWVQYSVRPTPEASKGRYGAHWWLNKGKPPGSDNRIWPQLPDDAFFASGFEGQYVVVVPSRELVVVRLGLTHPPARFRIGELVAEIADSLP